ncbi:MAG: hypothetical protein ACXIUM_05660 [Wenzhouxiangella sp.]
MEAKMKRCGVSTLAITLAMACGLSMASNAFAEEALERDQNIEWLGGDFPAQLEALQDHLDQFGMQLSDLRIQINAGKAAGPGQQEDGCTVTRSPFKDEGLKSVRLEASAPTCTEAWSLLEGS